MHNDNNNYTQVLYKYCPNPTNPTCQPNFASLQIMKKYINSSKNVILD